MAAVKQRLGRIPCPECGHQVVLRENEAGTLTLNCDECDFSGFAKKGTSAAARWRGKLPKASVQEPALGKVPKEPALGNVPKAPDQTLPAVATVTAPGNVPKAGFSLSGLRGK